MGKTLNVTLNINSDLHFNLRMQIQSKLMCPNFLNSLARNIFTINFETNLIPVSYTHLTLPTTPYV